MAEPKIPELWWSPTMGAIQNEDSGSTLFRVFGGGTGSYWGSFLLADWPADAVQLAPAADRDLVLWLHAEAQWWLSQYMHDVTLWKRQLDEMTVERDAWKREHDEAAAERDGLQARIDAALAKLDAYEGYGAGMMFHDELRAALLCVCQPDCCLGEGDPPNQCEHCATIDGELPCPVADAALQGDQPAEAGTTP